MSDYVEDVRKALCDACALNPDVVFTTGGTGMRSRDNTPEATTDVCHRMVPGIPEYVRAHAVHANVYLSRMVAGVVDSKSGTSVLIVNLPGRPHAALECAALVLPLVRMSASQLRK